jgi:hypothetical protein
MRFKEKALSNKLKRKIASARNKNEIKATAVKLSTL